jgi:hypothetical protein
MDRHPLLWMAGATAAVACAGLLVRGTQRWYDQLTRPGVAVSRPPGAVLVKDANPLLLGVHRPIDVEGAAGDWPAYVMRDTDLDPRGVRAAVRDAVGVGAMVLLVGGSSVGKSRCALEALRALVPDWWLLHPADADAVRDLAADMVPGLRVVVWLDELQRYLGGERGLAAASLRMLLQGPGQVVVVGTLWPEYYAAYTALPQPGQDAHAVGRAVAELARVVPVAAEFSAAEAGRAERLAAQDRRIEAALQVRDYGFTQAMAAAPQLIARWRDAGPYAAAVLNAALDATRLARGRPTLAEFTMPDAPRGVLPAALLRAAAPGYVQDRGRARAPDDWFETALAYATQTLCGAAAALEPVPTPGSGMGEIAGYLPADYLVQHAARSRAGQLGAATLWVAMPAHLTDPGQLLALGATAERLGLYRHAAALYKRAVLAGHQRAGLHLLSFLASHGFETGQAARWVALHASVADPGLEASVSRTVGTLRGLGTENAARALAGRIADHADLTKPDAAAGALSSLNKVGALSRARGLADRIARNADVTSAWSAAFLLGELVKAGCHREAHALAERTVQDTDLTDAVGVNRLLGFLQKAGESGQVPALARRDGLTDPGVFAQLLQALTELGADADARVLADRAASHAAPVARGTSHLIQVLDHAGAKAQAHALSERTARYVDIAAADSEDKFDFLVWMWKAMIKTGAEVAATVLADRIARHANLTNTTRGITQSLALLHETGAGPQASVLSDRIVSDADLTAPCEIDLLLRALHAIGDEKRMRVLASRAARYTGPIRSTRCIGMSPLGHLLESLHHVGARAEMHTLADRMPEWPHRPEHIGSVLTALHQVGAEQQARMLADRAARSVDLANGSAIYELLRALHQMGARAQAHALLARQPARYFDPNTVSSLLIDLLRRIGAEAQAQLLVEQYKTADFGLYLEESQARQCEFRYGQTPDGAPSPPWSWNDLPWFHAEET